jgi:DNA-binding GntR family transcriptional regulator
MTTRTKTRDAVGHSPDRNRSLADIAYRRIEEMIVNQDLQPWSMISEKQLSEELQFGRTPVREALQRLRLEGYIEIHPSRGVQVAAVDITKQLELIEVRRPLEDLVVRLACAHATIAEREVLRGLALEIVAAASESDQRRFLTANQSIQECIAKATHNSVLVLTTNVIHGMSRRLWLSYLQETDSFEQAARMNAAVLDAIIDRNETAATLHMKQLLDFLERLTRDAIDQRFGRPPQDVPPSEQRSAALPFKP